MKPEINTNYTNIPYKLIRSKRRTLALEIGEDGGLLVRAPMRISLEIIEKLVREKQTWILKHAGKIMRRKGAGQPKKFTEGESFLFFGEQYKLKLSPKQKNALEFGEGFSLHEASRHRAKYYFIRWYKQRAKKHITSRVEHYASRYGIGFKNISINDARKRWGSCSSRGNLNFSWRLILAPAAIIDYVVVHELAHRIEHNHSKKFWQTVAGIMPDFAIRRRWLKEHGYQLNI